MTIFEKCPYCELRFLVAPVSKIHVCPHCGKVVVEGLQQAEPVIKAPTEPAEINAEVHRMAWIVAVNLGLNLTNYLSKRLRPLVEQDLAASKVPGEAAESPPSAEAPAPEPPPAKTRARKPGRAKPPAKKPPPRKKGRQ